MTLGEEANFPQCVWSGLFSFQLHFISFDHIDSNGTISFLSNAIFEGFRLFFCEITINFFRNKVLLLRQIEIIVAILEVVSHSNFFSLFMFIIKTKQEGGSRPPPPSCWMALATYFGKWLPV
jgi:hypothetical protein